MNCDGMGEGFGALRAEAGTCMSIWAAVQDDLAAPGSADAVARESSRVLGVIAHGGRTTLDPFVVRKEIGGNPRIHPSLFPLYGVKKLEDLETPEVAALIRGAYEAAGAEVPVLVVCRDCPDAGAKEPEFLMGLLAGD